MPSRRMQRKLQQRAENNLDAAVVPEFEFLHAHFRRTQENCKTVSNKALYRTYQQDREIFRRANAPPVDPEDAVRNNHINLENLVEYCRVTDTNYIDVQQARDGQKYARWAQKALSRAETSHGPRDATAKKGRHLFALHHEEELEGDDDPDHDRCAQPESATRQWNSYETPQREALEHKGDKETPR